MSTDDTPTASTLAAYLDLTPYIKVPEPPAVASIRYAPDVEALLRTDAPPRPRLLDPAAWCYSLPLVVDEDLPDGVIKFVDADGVPLRTLMLDTPVGALLINDEFIAAVLAQPPVVRPDRAGEVKGSPR